MADKFLESMDMKEIMEDVKMTRLGRMLVEDGRSEGRKVRCREATEILLVMAIESSQSELSIV